MLSVSFSFLTFVTDEALTLRLLAVLKWSLRPVACSYGKRQEQGPFQESVANKGSLAESLAWITKGM